MTPARTGSAADRTRDLDRLARAVHLDCEALGAERWRVTGGAGIHFVRLLGSRYECDCDDARIRRGVCKHVLRVRLARGDDSTIRGLRELVAAPGASRQRIPDDDQMRRATFPFGVRE